MTGVYAGTRTTTNTYTEPRARYVTDKAFEDIIGIETRGLISSREGELWREDILFFLEMEALVYFELQFTKPNGVKAGLKYIVVSDGSIYCDDESGGDDFWTLPKSTQANIFVKRKTAKNEEAVKAYLIKRGYISGNAIGGVDTHQRDYSKNGFGFQKNKTGTWD
jgi:Bacterial HORMA domain family 1